MNQLDQQTNGLMQLMKQNFQENFPSVQFNNINLSTNSTLPKVKRITIDFTYKGKYENLEFSGETTEHCFSNICSDLQTYITNTDKFLISNPEIQFE